MKKKMQGFTLVELLAVIIIIAIILVLVVPTVLDATNKAKKDSFYIYAQELQGKAVAKYTQDMDDETNLSDCYVYDIRTDLSDKNNTGNYEGWVKVSRTAVSEENKKLASIHITNANPLQYVRYCITEGNTCTPDKSYNIAPDAKDVTVAEIIKNNQKLCVNYQYIEGTNVKEGSLQCVDYNSNSAEDIINSYKYDITLTLKSPDFAVQDFNYVVDGEDVDFKEEFNKAIDSFQEIAKTRSTNPMMISSPVCKVGDPVTYKGTTTIKTEKAQEVTTTSPTFTCPTLSDDQKKFNIILELNGGTAPNGQETKFEQCVGCETSKDIFTPTREGYFFAGWYYDKAFSKQLVGSDSKHVTVSEKLDGTKCVTGYNDVYLYAKWSLDPNSTTTPTVQTTQENTTSTNEVITTSSTTTTTARDTTDMTLLLDTLNVSGQNIEFSPIKFDYEVTVPYSQTSIGVQATAHTPDVTDIDINGNDPLLVGTNEVLINLTNHETYKQNYYRVIVNRLDQGGNLVTQPTNPINPEWDPSSGAPDPTLEDSNAGLEYLMVSGYVLNFNPNIYSYDLNVNSLDPLLISYKTIVKGALVKIDGNENLHDGSEVTVFVQSRNSYYTKTYKITVHFQKETSNQTKYLRTIMVVLLIILGCILVVSTLNKKKVKEDNNNNLNNFDNVANGQINANTSASPFDSTSQNNDQNNNQL